MIGNRESSDDQYLPIQPACWIVLEGAEDQVSMAPGGKRLFLGGCLLALEGERC